MEGAIPHKNELRALGTLRSLDLPGCGVEDGFTEGLTLALDSEGLRAGQRPQSFRNDTKIREIPLIAYHHVLLIEYNQKIDLV